jgi:hypothetical protein
MIVPVALRTDTSKRLSIVSLRAADDEHHDDNAYSLHKTSSSPLQMEVKVKVKTTPQHRMKVEALAKDGPEYETPSAVAQ